jgi:hypothetical protein|tara:strand:+ start:392 stop:973 length:582 start_codon:yes stop_codon:yes gene_type:complete
MANVNQYIPLVTAAEVISNSFTNANTDPALVSNNTILLAELAHIKPALGKKFYEEIKTQHNNGTLTTNNQTLVDDFLTRCLCWFVRFEVINEVQSNSTSAGIVHNIDEFATIVDPAELNAYKQDTYRKAEIYLKDMIDYMQDDDQNGYFPTYDSNRPNTGSTYKNHGIIMYDSIYTRHRNYLSWKDFCPCDDC